MIPRHHLLILGGALLCASALRAEDPAPGKADAAPEPYQLKNRSTFSCAEATARAPFWPIGWVHHEGVSSVVSKEAPRANPFNASAFRVSSILLGAGATPSLAVINGRAYSEGEFLKMPRGSALLPARNPDGTVTPAAAPVRTRVQRISDGFIVLQRATESITVPLFRPEMALRKVEDPVLDEDR